MKLRIDGWMDGWMDYAHMFGKSDPLDNDLDPQEPSKKMVGHRSVRSEA